MTSDRQQTGSNGQPGGGDPHSINDILDRLKELAGRNDRVAVGDMVEAMGHRSYGPFLILPALIEVSPLGGVPGLPTVLAAIVILFAVQMLFGREHLWLPAFVRRRSMEARKVAKATDKMRPVARRMDRWFHGRLPALTRGPFIRIAAGISILLALSVPPLELFPFASTLPMGAILLFGLALLVRDGLLMLAAILLTLGTIGLGINLLVSGG